MRRLLLWDIDGTLIRGGGVGSAALTNAAASVLGRPVDGRSVMMHGKTDPEILTEMLVAADVAPEDLPALLPPVLAEAERQMVGAEAALRARGELIGGVKEVLVRMAATPGVCQSVVTGNLVGNAKVKLAAFGLTQYLDVDVGAYGTDHHDRRELVPLALERTRRLRDEHYHPHEVWVIGDTPADLTCAEAAGVRCLLVATGQIPLDELRPLKADRVLADLTDTDQVCAILRGSFADPPG